MVTISPPRRPVDRYSRPMELLEREAELGALHAALDEARSGRGETVFVCGESGIGKTSIIRQFLDEVEEAAVLEGRCDNLIAPRAFGPFRDMARSSEHLPTELELHPDRDLLLRGLHDLLASSLRPTVLVIEDAHWLDDASLDVVRYILHRISRLHGLLILSLRESELPHSHPLRTASVGPSHQPPQRLELGPLSAAAVAKIAARFGYETERLMAASGGNPFYLTEVLASAPHGLPATIRDTVAARAARLSGTALEVVQVLSVIPDGADPALARALFGDDPAALEEAEASGLLESTPRRIGFRHELAQRAVEESLSFARRLACNQQLLEALITTDADPTMLVHAARAAGDAKRATSFALEMLRSGVAPTSHREIWTLSRIALEHTAELTRAEIAGLHLRAARAGQAVNRHSEARVHASEAVSVLRHGEDPAALVEALMEAAFLAGALGDYGGAEQAAQQARQILEPQTPSIELAKCYAVLGGVALVVGRNEAALGWAARAIDLAEKHGWNAPLIHGLGVRGFIRAGTGDEGGYADLDRARKLGAAHGPVDRYITVVYNTAVALLRWCRPRDAEALVDEAEHIARVHGLDNFLFMVHVQRALMLILRGEMTEAEALLDDITGREGSDPGAIGSTALALLGRIYTRRGDERAAEIVERAWTMAKAADDAQKMAVAGITRIEYLWLAGDRGGVRSLGCDLLELAQRCGHPRLHAETARYLARVGEPAEACDHCPENYRAALSGDTAKAAELWLAAGQPYEQALELVESNEAAVAFEGLRILDRIGATRTAALVRHQLRSDGLQGVPRGPRKSDDGTVGILTDRQLEVLRLVAAGLTNQEIADELYVARRTVDNHVSAILTRLGVESRHDAVDEAVARGLVEQR